jgi:hypothetical protein
MSIQTTKLICLRGLELCKCEMSKVKHTGYLIHRLRINAKLKKKTVIIITNLLISKILTSEEIQITLLI